MGKNQFPLCIVTKPCRDYNVGKGDFQQMQTAKTQKPKLYLVRHAQSTNNAYPEPQRIPDPPLTDLGKQQALALAKFAPQIDATDLLTSPFLRTLQTTEPIVHTTGLVPVIHAELFEQGGCYRGYDPIGKHPEPGLRRSEIAEHFPGWHIDPAIDEQGWNKLTHYETIAMARARAKRVALWLREQFQNTTARVLVIIHADFKLRLLESLLQRDDLEASLGSVINTSISSLSLESNSWQLDTWNNHQHLPTDWITS